MGFGDWWDGDKEVGVVEASGVEAWAEDVDISIVGGAEGCYLTDETVSVWVVLYVKVCPSIPFMPSYASWPKGRDRGLAVALKNRHGQTHRNGKQEPVHGHEGKGLV